MPICRGSYVVFNIDFNVVAGARKKKSDSPLASGGANTAINFSYIFVTCTCFFLFLATHGLIFSLIRLIVFFMHSSALIFVTDVRRRGISYLCL